MWNSYLQVVNRGSPKDVSPLKQYRLAQIFLVSRYNLMGKYEDIVHIVPENREISSLLEGVFIMLNNKIISFYHI